MKKAILFFFIVTMICLYQSPCKAKELTDALETAITLNNCNMSLYKIKTYNDKLVLDEEYNEIINNIVLTKIRNSEVLSLLTDLMEKISKFKISDEERKRILADHEEQVTNALYSSLSEIPSSLSGGGGNPYVMAAMAVAKTGSAYANYRNTLKKLDKAKADKEWMLDKDIITQLNDIQMRFLRNSWSLMKRYDMPDKWRLTEKQIAELFSIIKATDLGEVKYRRFSRIKDNFEAFPPFWYFYGQIAQELNMREQALQSYAKYEKIGKGFFREDNYYKSILMNRINLLDFDVDRATVISNLRVLTKDDDKDFKKNMYAAICYIRLGLYKEASDLLEANIDNKQGIAASKILLGEIYSLSKDTKKLANLIDNMLKEDYIKNQEVLFLLGKTSEIRLLEKMKEQILSIYITIDKNTLTDDTIIVTVPDKWIISSGDNFNLSIIYDGYEYFKYKTTFDKNRGLFSYHFENIFDENSFIKKNVPSEIKICIKHPLTPITLTGMLFAYSKEEELGYLGKTYERTKKMIKREKEDSIKMTKTNYVVGYKRKEIITNDNCYRITDEHKILPCQIPVH